MTIRGLNHITLAVKDLDNSVKFYSDVLGLTLHKQWDGGAYFSAGDLWFSLSVDADTDPSSDYTHYAFDVAQSDFEPLRKRILDAGATEWKINRSEGDSFYFLDPEGHKLELHVGSLQSRLATMANQRGAA